jgi:membrane protease YdiL (CAAX protease family)
LDIAITPEDVAGPSPSRRPFWGTVGWGIVIMILSTVTQAIGLVAATAFDVFYLHRTVGLTGMSFARLIVADAARGDVLSAVIVVSDLACVAAILWIVRLKKLPARDYLALLPVRAAVMLKWTGMLLAYIILTSVAASLFHVDFGGAVMGNLLTGSRWPWLFWIAVVFAAPAFEEVFFRGFLFRGFEASFLGSWGTIILTAALWAALHIQYNLYGIAFIAGTGILFGLARAKTGSLIVTLTLHAGMNFFETTVYTLYGA